MSSALYSQWIGDILIPNMMRLSAAHPNLKDEPRSNRQDVGDKKVLLLTDSWSGQTNQRIRDRLSSTLQLVIPPHTTGQVQPLDVGFFRQLKIFIRRLNDEALITDNISDITSREGIINLMSLIFNQLQAPAYHDLWRHAWRNTDPYYSEDELSIVPPPNVNSVQFGSSLAPTCEITDCNARASIHCSHCGTSLCLHHFLQRLHFHRIEEEMESIATDVLLESGFELEEDQDVDDDDLIFRIDEQVPRRNQSNPTSTTFKPTFVEIERPCVDISSLIMRKRSDVHPKNE